MSLWCQHVFTTSIDDSSYQFTSPSQSPTPVPFLQYDNGRYIGVYSTSIAVTAYEASTYCNSIGRTLASIHSETDNDLALETITAIAGRNASFSMWIGGFDMTKENDWKWIDGTSFNYSNWLDSYDKPNNKGDCTRMYSEPGYNKWYDVDCGGSADS